jgi:DNA-binding winged helix-turn-helix (wHTH) protein
VGRHGSPWRSHDHSAAPAILRRFERVASRSQRGNQLRKKLEPVPSHPLYLVTVLGMGYRFVPDGDPVEADSELPGAEDATAPENDPERTT